MENEINIIVQKHFNQSPKKVERMKAGICNEVYRVEVDGKAFIVRMNNLNRFLKGSSRNIPIFKSKGISVPEILFEDYSKQTISYAYQIMTVMEGEDLGNVIRGLTSDELVSIAKDISGIFLKLGDIQTNGKFGWVADNETKLVDSWSEVMLKMYYDVCSRNDATGVVGKELIDLYSQLITKHKLYFDSVPSRFVYDDISSKNVIIKDGKFNGLVDLDQVMYGDFLEPIGRIKASWYGTDYGRVYTESILDCLSLNQSQREMITVYALLSRINWLSEIGIQFNQNTSVEIDQTRVDQSRKIIELIKQELSAGIK